MTFGIDVSHLSNISAGSIKLIVTEKGAGVNTMDSNIITDLSRLEITADGDLVLKANLSSQTDISLTSHSGDITQSGDIKAVQNIDSIVFGFSGNRLSYKMLVLI
jgi:hypothetical protein